MRTADKIFEVLKAHTDHVFLLPGGGAMYLVDALGQSGIPYTATLHEQHAGYMAIGYALATYRLGVCLVTSGPGATNAYTPCVAAWADSAPVLFISGQANSDTLVGNTNLRTRGVQEINIIEGLHHITKLAHLATSPADCIERLYDMITECREGRPGPCWLDVPMDIQGAEYA